MAITDFCTKCGSLKVGSYLKEYWCGPCKEGRRTELRKQKRQAAGLPEYGSGRDPKCKICREEKQDPYKDGSWCKECKLKKERERYRKKKEQNGGLTVVSENRNPICSCGVIKKKASHSYCTACQTKKTRARRRLLAQDEEYRASQRQKERQRIIEDAVYARKMESRKAVKIAIKKGALIQRPCEICGELKVDAHHDDYDRPLDVRWLCRKHHNEHHRNETLKE